MYGVYFLPHLVSVGLSSCETKDLPGKKPARPDVSNTPRKSFQQLRIHQIVSHELAIM